MRSKAKNLSSLFRSAVKTSKTSKDAEDAALKHYISSIDPSLSEAITQRSFKPPNFNKVLPKVSGDLQLSNVKIQSTSGPEESVEDLTKAISSILREGTSVNSPGPQRTDDENALQNVLDLPWFSNMSNNSVTLRRKEVSRERKQKWVFKSTQANRFSRLVRNCAQKLGTAATLEVFGKLGRETGVKEYNALVGVCIEKARTTNDVEVVLDEISNVLQLFRSMKEQGFMIEDETYGPVLMFLIDMDMMEEFNFFFETIKNGNPSSDSRLGYYEMLLWVRINDKQKVQELCEHATTDDGTDKSGLQENYLLALSENGWKEEFLQLLEIIDITKLSSVNCVVSIFKCLGKLSLHTFAEKFLLAFKTSETEAEKVTEFIFSYAVSIPNLAVEDVISKFKNLHCELEMKPSSASYEKLISYCCDLLKVHVAFDLVNEMCESGFTLSMDALHSILNASEEACEFNMVRQVYSVICRYNLKPSGETFRSMISLCVKMKDFDGAYNFLKDLEKMNLTPTSSMYNAIMGGYYREKNIYGGLMVRKQMELAGVKPDSQTFGYLIGNCDREEDVIRYYEEMMTSGVQVTKQIFMALINAYAACGQFEKAKQVISDKGIPIKNLNEVKSVLVSALASHGQMSDALSIHEEIKQAGCDLEPKAIISLIEHHSDGELSKLLQLVDELKDPYYWIDGCRRVLLYCVQHKHLSSAVDLLKRLNEKLCNDELVMEALFDEVFALVAESEPTHLLIGLELLQFIKNEMRLTPTRKCLDFLLSACVNAKDVDNSRLIWKEYKEAGLPYNILTYLRMYQAFLASGDRKSAKILLHKIPKDDAHVRCVVKECQIAYIESASASTEVRKKKTEMNKFDSIGNNQIS